MLYALVGTSVGKRDKGRAEFAKFGSPKEHLYQEHVDRLESLIDAQDIFGEPTVIMCMSLLTSASSKEKTTALLSSMKESPNIFVLDEPFLGGAMYTKLAKVAHTVIDAREEKVKDVRVFALCDHVARRDKKEAWKLYMTLRKTETGEAIQGALWWKWMSMWAKAKEGKKVGFSEEECITLGGMLLRAPLRAHRGEADIYLELEQFILSL